MIVCLLTVYVIKNLPFAFLIVLVLLSIFSPSIIIVEESVPSLFIAWMTAITLPWMSSMGTQIVLSTLSSRKPFWSLSTWVVVESYDLELIFVLLCRYFVSLYQINKEHYKKKNKQKRINNYYLGKKSEHIFLLLLATTAKSGSRTYPTELILSLKSTALLTISFPIGLWVMDLLFLFASSRPSIYFL